MSAVALSLLGAACGGSSHKTSATTKPARHKTSASTSTTTASTSTTTAPVVTTTTPTTVPVTTVPVTSPPSTSTTTVTSTTTTPTTTVPAGTSPAYKNLQGTWSATGFTVTIEPLPNHPGYLTLAQYGGMGRPGASSIDFTGVNAGSGSLQIHYKFPADPNTITVFTGDQEPFTAHRS